MSDCWDHENGTLNYWRDWANIDRLISKPGPETCTLRPDSTPAARPPKKSRSRLRPRSPRSFPVATAVSCASAKVIFTQPSPRQAEKPLSSTPRLWPRPSQPLLAAGRNGPACPSDRQTEVALVL